MRRYSIALFFLLFSCFIVAQHQIVIEVDRDTIEMGDKVNISWTITADPSIPIETLDFTELNSVENLAYFADTTFLEEFVQFEVLSSQDGLSKDDLIIDYNGRASINATVGIYDIGVYALPYPIILPDEADNIIPPTQVLLYVMPPKGMSVLDSIDIQPIKDIYRHPGIGFPWMKIILFLCLLLALAYLIYYIVNKNRGQSKLHTEVVKEEVVVPAHEKAITALKALEQRELWQNGYEKEYHYELTAIMRRYLEDRFYFPAAEMTTSQVESALNNENLSIDQKSKLIEILNISDIVKFAKGEAGRDINIQFIKYAYQFIEDTKVDDLI